MEFGQGPVVEWVVQVIGLPIAVVVVTGQRADDAVETLVYVDFEVSLDFANKEAPLGSLAKITIINDVITHVIIGCDVGSPDVQKQFDVDVPEVNVDIVPATHVGVEQLSEHEVLVLVVHWQVIVQANVEVQTEVVTPISGTAHTSTVESIVLNCGISATVFIGNWFLSILLC